MHRNDTENHTGSAEKERSREKKQSSWNARRIAALIGIILLLALYGSTMVFALMGSPNAHAFLMASIYCTIAVPVLLYAITLTTKNLRGRGVQQEIHDAYDKVKEQQEEEIADTASTPDGETNPSGKSENKTETKAESKN